MPTKGLSPRVRGNPMATVRASSSRGSIPACAGEPCRCWTECAWTPVYPRVCGGTYGVMPVPDAKHGLSPRVRGNHERRPASSLRPGSIPACAGEPSTRRRRVCNSAVYPRVCGGTISIGGTDLSDHGLSPRVRGNPCPCRRHGHPHRSIPACAGEPRAATTRRQLQQVYPRVCGGTTYRWSSSIGGTGLSPRVRGNRTQLFDRTLLLGSIPACAGEPGCSCFLSLR